MNIFNLIDGLIKNALTKPREKKRMNTLQIKAPFEIDLKDSLSWSWIVLHHSATPDGNVNDWEGIRKWHTGKTGSPDPKNPNYNPYIAKPDRDIGYHFGIEVDNAEYVYRIGRPLSMAGAHTKEFNQKAIGICTVGGYDKISPTETQLSMLLNLVKYLQSIFKIPKNQVIGHWQSFLLLKQATTKEEAWTKFKTCPGRMMDLDAFRSILL